MATSNQDEQNNTPGLSRCPYLGIKDDPETRYAFSNIENRCFYVTPSQRVTPSHQDEACLTCGHKQCPVFKGEYELGFPPELRGEARPKTKKTGQTGWVVLAVCLLVGYMVYLTWKAQANSTQAVEAVRWESTPGSEQSTPNPSERTVVIAADLDEQPAALTASAALQVTKTALQATGTPKITPSATPGPLLETPFGGEVEFLIYPVRTGESYASLASKFETSPEVIMAANQTTLKFGLQPELLLVIQPGQRDVSGVEDLRALFLEKEARISEVASQYGVTVQEIQAYNGLGGSEEIPAGRWLVFPEREVMPTATVTVLLEADTSAALMGPFGPNNEYILHRVQTGESLAVLVERYRTSLEVILRANLIEGIIQAEQVLVIVINRTDPAGIEPFQVVQLEEDTSLPDLASRVGVQVSDLSYCNGLAENEKLAAGQWIIYPVQE